MTLYLLIENTPPVKGFVYGEAALEDDVRGGPQIDYNKHAPTEAEGRISYTCIMLLRVTVNVR